VLFFIIPYNNIYHIVRKFLHSWRLYYSFHARYSWIQQYT